MTIPTRRTSKEKAFLSASDIQALKADSGNRTYRKGLRDLLKKYAKLPAVLFGSACPHLWEVRSIYQTFGSKVAVYKKMSAVLVVDTICQIFIVVRNYVSHTWLARTCPSFGTADHELLPQDRCQLSSGSTPGGETQQLPPMVSVASSAAGSSLTSAPGLLPPYSSLHSRWGRTG